MKKNMGEKGRKLMEAIKADKKNHIDRMYRSIGYAAVVGLRVYPSAEKAGGGNTFRKHTDRI